MYSPCIDADVELPGGAGPHAGPRPPQRHHRHRGGVRGGGGSRPGHRAALDTGLIGVLGDFPEVGFSQGIHFNRKILNRG